MGRQRWGFLELIGQSANLIRLVRFRFSEYLLEQKNTENN